MSSLRVLPFVRCKVVSNYWHGQYFFSFITCSRAEEIQKLQWHWCSNSCTDSASSQPNVWVWTDYATTTTTRGSMIIYANTWCQHHLHICKFCEYLHNEAEALKEDFFWCWSWFLLQENLVLCAICGCRLETTLEAVWWIMQIRIPTSFAYALWVVFVIASFCNHILQEFCIFCSSRKYGCGRNATINNLQYGIMQIDDLHRHCIRLVVRMDWLSVVQVNCSVGVDNVMSPTPAGDWLGYDDNICKLVSNLGLDSYITHRCWFCRSNG